jgi:hypothetical protein
MMCVGMSADFVPNYDESQKLTPKERRDLTISAKICFINWKHKYFTVEWETSGLKCRESFKFTDIGKQVSVGGRKCKRL